MAASKKLYVALAAELKYAVDTAGGPYDVSAVAYAIRQAATAFKADNAAFRYDTFFLACGLDAWGKPIPADEPFAVIAELEVTA